MKFIWAGICPKCGWATICRWREHDWTCKRCPPNAAGELVKLEWKQERWA